MKLTIYHNPRCSKSRQTLEIIRQHGIEPTVIHYLDDMPDAATLLWLATLLNTDLSALLRRGESEYRDATDLPADGDARALADWLARHPPVLERPIVVDDARGRAVIGRPPENVLTLLDPDAAP